MQQGSATTTNPMLEPSQRPTWIHLRGDVCGFLRHMPGALLLGTVGWMPITAAAQPSGCPDVCALYSDLLMAPERALIGSIRTIEKVAKPAPGPRHTRGHWMQRDVFLGSAAFDTTFYVGKGLVQRIEMVSTASQAQCRARIQQSVHWAAGGALVHPCPFRAGDVRYPAAPRALSSCANARSATGWQ